MRKNLQDWINGSETPADVYELLGFERLFPNRKDLLKSINSANREILRYQSFGDEESIAQSQQLLLVLAEAKHAVSDEARWQVYDEQILTRLRRAYYQHAGTDSSAWLVRDLRRWLHLKCDIHASRLDDAVQWLLGRRFAEETEENAVWLAEPDASGQETIASSSAPTQEPMPPGGVWRDRRGPRGRAGHATGGTAKSRRPARRAKSSDSRIARSSKSRPPSKSSRGPGPAPAQEKVPPRTGPPSKKPPPGPAARGGTPASTTGSPSNVLPQRSPVDPGIYWVVGAAAVTALVLIVLLILIFFPPWSRSGSKGPSTPDTSETAGVDTNSDAAPARSDTGSPDGNGAPDRNEAATGQQEPLPEDAPESAEAPTSEKGIPTDPAQPPPDSKPPAPQPPEPAPPPTAPTELVHDFTVTTIGFSHDGRYIATGGDQTVVCVWSLADGQKVAELTEHTAPVTTLEFGDDQLATGSDDGVIRLWRGNAWSLDQELHDSSRTPVTRVAWLAGDSLVSGHADGIARVWDTRRGRLDTKLSDAERAGAIRGIAGWKAGLKHSAVTAHVDGSLVLWDAANGKMRRMVVAEGSDLAPSTIGDADPPGGNEPLVTFGSERNIRDLAVSPDGTAVALANGDVELWALDNPGASLRTFLMPGRNEQDGYRAVAWSDDGKQIAAGDAEGELVVWKTDRNKVTFLEQLGECITSIGWGPDNTKLAVAAASGEVRLFDVPDDPGTPVVRCPFEGDLEDMFAKANTFLTERNWPALAVALNLLEAYTLPAKHRYALEELRHDVDREIDTELEDIVEDIDQMGLDGHIRVELQELLDLSSRNPTRQEKIKELFETAGNRAS